MLFMQIAVHGLIVMEILQRVPILRLNVTRPQQKLLSTINNSIWMVQTHFWIQKKYPQNKRMEDTSLNSDS